jgi:hypothetical protein
MTRRPLTHERSARARQLQEALLARRLAYVAHPIGKDVSNNLARARRWFVWLWHRHPELSLCMPWLAPCEVLDDQDPETRRRGLEDDLIVLGRCDLIILVGGELSPGMATELATARRLGLAQIDYLYLGAEPPALEAA